MTFANSLELYTTVFGWTIYNILWGIFATTGIALYPFLKMIYDNWRGPAAESSSVATVGVGSLQRMKWSFVFKLLVFLLCVLPITTLNMKEARYVKACGGETHIERAFGNTETTWDDTYEAFRFEGDARVPVLFHLVMQLAAGTNHGVINNMPCIPDVIGIKRQLQSLVLPDPELKKEYDRFATECYLRAHNRIYKVLENPTLYPLLYDHIKNRTKETDRDLRYFDEIDSDILLDTPGLYKPCNDMENCAGTLQAQKPVNGFKPQTGDRNRDAGMPAWQAEKGSGQPYCDEWWTSLRPRLIEAAKFSSPVDASGKKEYTSSVKDAFTVVSNQKVLWKAMLDEEYRDKLILRNLVYSVPADFTGLYGYSPQQSINASEGDLFSSLGVAALGGTSFALLSSIPGVGDVMESAVGEVAGFYVSLLVVKLAAPMMQALVLMLIFCLLPLYLIVSEYELPSAITAMVLVYVVGIFTLVFQLVDHLHQWLFTAMYPGASVWDVSSVLAIKPLILDAMILMLYIVGPALLLYLVTMAGQNVQGTGSSGDQGTRRAMATGGNIGGGAGRGAVRGSRALGPKRNNG